MVYSTLAGDQYDKVIVPRNEGVTTKTTLTGKEVCFFLSFIYSFICFVVSSSGIIYHKHLVLLSNIIKVHLMCIEEVGLCLCVVTWQDYPKS